MSLIPPPHSELNPAATERYEAMPIAELAGLWCEAQAMGVKQRFDLAGRFTHLLEAERYFLHLPHKNPERSFDLVLAVLRSPVAKPTKIQLLPDQLAPLVYWHGDAMAARFEAEAESDAEVRWMFGDAYVWTHDRVLYARLEKIADSETFGQDRWNLSQVEPIEFSALKTPALARAWVTEMSKPTWQDDDNVRGLSDCVSSLIYEKPNAVVDLVAEIARIEDDEVLLNFCAASMLAAVLGEAKLTRIEREAGQNEKFARLLAHIDYSGEADKTRARLDKATAAARAALPAKIPLVAAGVDPSEWASKALPKIELVMSGAGFFDASESSPVLRIATIGPRVAVELGKLPIAELADAWCASRLVDLRQMTEEVRYTEEYFAHLPHEEPHRALELALAVLRGNAETPVKMELENKFIGPIINSGYPDLIDKIEEEAKRNPQMRWLLGGIGWAISDEAIGQRLGAVADKAAWQAEETRFHASPDAIDFASLSTEELARTWVELRSLHIYRQFRNENCDGLSEFLAPILKKDPGRALDLVLAVLRTETNEALLEVLAREVFFPIVGAKTIERIEQEAATNDRLAWFVGGVWSWVTPKKIKDRIGVIVRRQRGQG